LPPQGEQLVIRIREGSAAADGDEARIALFGEDHGVTFLLASAQRWFNLRGGWRGLCEYKDSVRLFIVRLAVPKARLCCPPDR
jgi:hypothetical protein